MTNANDPQVSVSTIADLLKLSQRHVARLAKEGKLPAPQAGQMPLVQSLVAFIEYQRDSVDPQYAAERLRKTTEEADRIALENEKTRGNLVEVEAVYKHFEGLFIALRARILASGLTDAEQDELLSDLRGLKSRDFSEPTPSQVAANSACASQ